MCYELNLTTIEEVLMEDFQESSGARVTIRTLLQHFRFGARPSESSLILQLDYELGSSIDEALITDKDAERTRALEPVDSAFIENAATFLELQGKYRLKIMLASHFQNFNPRKCGQKGGEKEGLGFIRSSGFLVSP